MLTMLLGGLWHGASWNFMIWGGYHGALLNVERAFRGRRKIDEAWTWAYPFQAILTFALVLVGWVFFRAATLTESIAVLRQMFARVSGPLLLEPWHIGLAAGSLVVALVEEKIEWFDRLMETPVLVRAVALGCMLFCLEVFGVIDAAIPFIYFQF